MAKSKRRKPSKTKKRSNPKPYQVVEHPFVVMKNPIPEDIPFEKRIEALRGIGREASTLFEQEYQKLIDYFKEYDPVYLLSFCSRYFTATREGIDEEAINGYIDFPDFFLEVLQCLSLKFERCISAKPLNDQILSFKSTVSDFCRSQSRTHFNLLNGVTDPGDCDAIMLRAEMMDNTIAVRNWAYPNQIQRLAYDLAELAEPKFTNLHGFTSKNFLDILFSLPYLAEDKLNAHIQKTGQFLRAKNYTAVFDYYEANFPDVIPMNEEARGRLWESTGQNLRKLKYLLMAHSDIYLRDVYTHSLTEIHNHLSGSIPEEVIVRIMNKLSLTFGELSDVNKDYVFLDNPIHAKPFIKLDGHHFFSAVHHLFFHLSVDLLERFISNDEALKNEYSLKKGRYLEARVEQLFKEAFPGAQILVGSIWKCPTTDKDFENDLIVLIEDFAVIVECKSGTVSLPARRGAPERLFKTLQDLIITPSEQAIRFETYLEQNKQIHEFKTRNGVVNVIDSTKIKYYIPLGITLSTLGAIGCNLKKLIDSGITKHNITELAPSINLTDLEVIFEILTLRAEKLHYLQRRRELEIHLHFRGDEIDLLGFYLDHGFNIGEAEYDDSIHIDLTLKSKVVDPYFIGKQRGKAIKKPKLKKSKYWSDILTKLENGSPNWLLTSYILLNSQKEDQLKFENKLELEAKKIQKNKSSGIHSELIFYSGPKRRRYAIVGCLYKNMDIETRNTVLYNTITFVNDEMKDVRGIVILGYNLNMQHHPYSVIVASQTTNFFDNAELESTPVESD